MKMVSIQLRQPAAPLTVILQECICRAKANDKKTAQAVCCNTMNATRGSNHVGMPVRQLPAAAASTAQTPPLHGGQAQVHAAHAARLHTKLQWPAGSAPNAM